MTHEEKMQQYDEELVKYEQLIQDKLNNLDKWHGYDKEMITENE